MPQLVKGGKWAYGWVVVDPERGLEVPPQAWQEYGFQVGERAIFLPGSRRSGGFGVSTLRLLETSFGGDLAEQRALGETSIARSGRIALPPQVDLQPGDRLLAVRGSGLALGFVRHGPIYEEAQKHPELDVFGGEHEE